MLRTADFALISIIRSSVGIVKSRLQCRSNGSFNGCSLGLLLRDNALDAIAALNFLRRHRAVHLALLMWPVKLLSCFVLLANCSSAEPDVFAGAEVALPSWS
ncbi:hypothetical protein Nepgr_029679 [Nepenthes gracilis]|uniref:Uncharacterized protein n=1 Tax=Nepenthes gracilis TaxID=150966 RepID=A0AAD3TER3_NEPGR|nr:hypothetical protein Nepgr_029679 [Nepenthes gracilis]